MELLHEYVPYIDPRFNFIEHLAIYASIFTVFSGLFFLDSAVIANNDAKFALFLFVLIFNVYFLLKWLFRIGDVVFRTQVNIMRNWSCCQFLKKREVYDYEKDLSLII